MQSSQWAVSIPNSIFLTSLLETSATGSKANIPQDSYEEDQFAQTREPDSLFDDDIIPISEPISQPVSTPIPPEAPRAQTAAQQRPRNADTRSSNYGGRGRGALPGQSRGGSKIDSASSAPLPIPVNGTDQPAHQSKPIPTATTTTTTTPNPADSAPPPPSTSPPAPDSTLSGPTLTPSDPAPAATVTTDLPTPPPADQPTTSPQPQQPQQPRPPPAVRGPRHATGGVQRPKLSEDELSARLEAIKLKNSKLEAAHALAEADAASFEAREQAAKTRRREEGIARKAMEGEREKNRLRKLGARERREWDEGKVEGHRMGGEREERGARRGVYGGVVGGVGSGQRVGSGGGGGGNGGQEQSASTVWEIEGMDVGAGAGAGAGADAYADQGALGALSEVAVGEDAEGEGLRGQQMGGGEMGGGFRGRGRGQGRGRGGRGGRGRGRGDAPFNPAGVGMNIKRIEVPPSRLTEADFPALASGGAGPTATATATAGGNAVANRGNSTAAAAMEGGLKSPDIDPKGSWADQVEAGQAQEITSW
ncbi:hypothetical protein MMC10_001655 [Thelotrema lepadinum]|nr:hypothetical protein [Thelotrema lepadinum]